MKKYFTQLLCLWAIALIVFLQFAPLGIYLVATARAEEGSQAAVPEDGSGSSGSGSSGSQDSSGSGNSGSESGGSSSGQDSSGSGSGDNSSGSGSEQPTNNTDTNSNSGSSGSDTTTQDPPQDSSGSGSGTESTSGSGSSGSGNEDIQITPPENVPADEGSNSGSGSGGGSQDSSGSGSGGSENTAPTPDSSGSGSGSSGSGSGGGNTENGSSGPGNGEVGNEPPADEPPVAEEPPVGGEPPAEEPPANEVPSDSQPPANDTSGDQLPPVLGDPLAGPTDPSNGFPLLYRDALGQVVAACLEGTDPNCVLPGAGEEANFDPNQPTDFPDNFPSEFFYWIAESDKLSTPLDGKLSFRMALEGAFLNEDPAEGDQMVFGRIRLTGTGLEPNSLYTVTHPYGVDTYETNDVGIVRRGDGTEDIGCEVGPCDFSLALGSRIFDGFLGMAEGAPAGYLGDGATLGEVTGSPLGQNFFRIEGPGLPLGGLFTNLFTVAGKLFSGIIPPVEPPVKGPPAEEPPAQEPPVVGEPGDPGAGLIDPSNGFPLFYQDVLGTAVGACLDGSDPICVLPGAGEEANFDPNQPTVFSTNFPSEFFYWIAESDQIGIPDTGGKFMFRMAVEGAFLGEDPIPGDQMVFGRLRATGTGLVPNSTYTVTHPYGVDTYVTNAVGVMPRNSSTEDIGCEVGPCDFSLALASRVFQSFLQWDSGAPLGYLGDAITPHAVIGSPTGNNFVRIEGPGLPLGGLLTNLFTVSGKLFSELINPEEPPVNNQPPVSDSPSDEPPVAEEPPVGGEPPAEEPPADEVPSDNQLPADDTPSDQLPDDNPPANEPPADNPPATDNPTDNNVGSTPPSGSENTTDGSSQTGDSSQTGTTGTQTSTNTNQSSTTSSSGGGSSTTSSNTSSSNNSSSSQSSSSDNNSSNNQTSSISESEQTSTTEDKKPENQTLVLGTQISQNSQNSEGDGEVLAAEQVGSNEAVAQETQAAGTNPVATLLAISALAMAGGFLSIKSLLALKH
ncbi:MAG: hypothetical protein HYW45_02145 [Candidatus Daviesbacteria bacterium]|nr:MAG: hypothetical protein HYW45_02145 [Candidatus Daviesbacteria bacterium]